LSVDAVHVRSIRVLEAAVAPTFAGALGAVMSGGVNVVAVATGE
jgi:hypothetical protein